MAEHHNLDSLLAYAIGFLGLLISLTSEIQAGILLLSFLILVVRLLYDAVRFWRYLTRGK
jgi:hypothetical protein